MGMKILRPSGSASLLAAGVLAAVLTAVLASGCQAAPAKAPAQPQSQTQPQSQPLSKGPVTQSGGPIDVYTANPALPAWTLKVSGDSVFFQGQGAPFRTLRLGTRLEEWTKVLGSPSRQVDRAGGMFIWDNLGLLVTLRYPFAKNDPRVASLCVTFIQRDVDFWPKRPFSGVVEFNQARPGKTPVTCAFRRGLTRKEIDGKGFLWDMGYPNLSRFASFRLTGASEEDSVEAFFAQVNPTAVRLPWEPQP